MRHLNTDTAKCLAAVEPIFASKQWAEVVKILSLSRRETEIVKCILLRDANEATIASMLWISRHTVHTHSLRLYRKLSVNSRSQLISVVFGSYVSLLQAGGVDAVPSQLQK